MDGVLPTANFDRAHYDFKYVRREFLGDVRCVVFDVTPAKAAGKGLFEGRIWAEDQDFNIVRSTELMFHVRRTRSFSTWIAGG